MPRLYIKGIGNDGRLDNRGQTFSLCLTPFLKRAFSGGQFIGRLAVYRLSFAPVVRKFLSTPKASTGLSGMWKCIWAKKAKFSACSRPSALITFFACLYSCYFVFYILRNFLWPTNKLFYLFYIKNWYTYLI